MNLGKMALFFGYPYSFIAIHGINFFLYDSPSIFPLFLKSSKVEVRFVKHVLKSMIVRIHLMVNNELGY
jgi:hypothetical protein